MAPRLQAKLLTLVEDGIYFRIGSPEARKADLQIVCTTNAPEQLRPDFRDRFLSFTVPGVYKRRGDVLHYLYHFSPDVVDSLGKNDALVLMAYNWPGNTRQIETYVETLKYEKAREEYHHYPFVKVFWRDNPPGKKTYSEIILIPNENTANPEQKKFNKKLKAYGLDLVIEHDFAEIVNGSHQMFQGYYEGEINRDLIIPQFQKAHEGLKYYCKVTGHDIQSDENLILRRQGIKSTRPDLSGFKYDDLLLAYYTDLLRSTDGNKREAARRAGVNEKTFASRLKEKGIS